MTASKTPITDALLEQIADDDAPDCSDESFGWAERYTPTGYNTLGILIDHARSLERTNAALVEALEGVQIMLNTELRRYQDEPWAQRVSAALRLAKGEA